MAERDVIRGALQYYTFFGGHPPDVEPDTLIEYVRQGLSEISGKTSGKDSIIGGIRLLGELRIIKAKETLWIALIDSNKAVRNEAFEVLEKLGIKPLEDLLREKERLDQEWEEKRKRRI